MMQTSFLVERQLPVRIRLIHSGELYLARFLLTYRLADEGVHEFLDVWHLVLVFMHLFI